MLKFFQFILMEKCMALLNLISIHLIEGTRWHHITSRICLLRWDWVAKHPATWLPLLRETVKPRVTNDFLLNLTSILIIYKRTSGLICGSESHKKPWLLDVLQGRCVLIAEITVFDALGMFLMLVIFNIFNE